MRKEAYLFCKFLQVEIRKIDEDKWYEGTRRNCDPGNEFILDWIKRNGSNWRIEWDLSKCQHCNFWRVCGHLVKQDCIDFEPDKDEDIENLESGEL